MKKLTILAGLTAFAGLACAQSGYWLNEIYFNPAGTDNGFEFLEIGTNGSVMLPGIGVIEIDGDAANAGRINGFYELSGLGTGTNGLLLWRDAATTYSYIDSNGNTQAGPEPETTLKVQDFNPDIQNGSSTFLLVYLFGGTVGQDLDTNNDGVLESTPWSTVLDGVGLVAAGTGNFSYAGAFGEYTFSGQSFAPAYLGRLRDGTEAGGGWLASTTVGTGLGPITYNTTQYATEFNYGGDITGQLTNRGLTPGGANTAITPVPEPATLAVLGLGLLAAKRRRK